MQRIVSIAVLAGLAVLAFVAQPDAAQAQRKSGTMVTTEPEPLVERAPRRARPQVRARPKIRVRPRYPYRSYHSLYPLPYETEYPGPNARRQCISRLVTEYRPSGTVVVPRMRCRWVQR